MKPIYKLLILLTLTLFAAAEEKSASADAVPLTPLIEAMDKGGLVNLDNYLDNNGKWPRISTDSFALKNKITNQKELVVLSNRLIKLLRARADAELPSEIEALDSEAKLFFALGEKFWKADGYRNLVSSLMCIELGSHRCGKIVLVSRGEKMGPNRPEVFKALNPGDMLKLFIAMIPENDAFSKAELSQKLISLTR